MARTDKLGTTATTTYRRNGATRVKYHQTEVVSFSNHKVCLKTDGYYTATTKLRMNQASNQFGLGFSVFQRDFDWYVMLPNGARVDFVDGMTFEIPSP